MKKLTLLFLLMVASFAIAQQPQSQTAPFFSANAKYTNGVAPGYAPTTGSGLTLNLGKGTANCLGILIEYVGGTLTMTNSTTNYVYLDPASSCAPTSNTSGFNSSTIWIAKVTASGGAITVIDDVRTGFLAPGTGSGTLTGAGVNGDLAYWSGTTSLGDLSDFTFASHTIAGGASSIFDLSAATGTAALKVPSHTTNTASAAGVVDYDSTNSNYHANSGADSLLLLVPTASIPATGDLIDASVVSSKLVAHDSGIPTANVVKASSPGLGYCHFAGSTQTCTSVTIPRGIPFTIGDPAGSVLTVASTTTDYVTVPFACTISGYHLTLQPSGTITVKFWKIASGTAAPTSGNSISTSGVGISTGTAVDSSTTSDFTTTTVSVNDHMAMNVTAVSTASYVNGVLTCDESQ
jgi:hypothetical protein